MKSKYFNECIGNATGGVKDSLVELAYQRIPKNVRHVIEGKYKVLLSEQETYCLNPSYTETAAYNEALERDKIYVRNKLAESLKVSLSEITEYMVEQIVLNGARSYDYLKIASNREP